MPNWCANTIAFYQADNGNDLLDAFYADIQKYQNFTDPETGKPSNWVGHWFDEKRINTASMYTRGFFTSCELYSSHVLINMETAWGALPEVWDSMASRYGLEYVYISEECGNEVYVNTDMSGRFFQTRYILDYFDVDDLNLDSETEAKYGVQLREIGSETKYYDSFDEVTNDFKCFGFAANQIEELNGCLERFSIRVYEFDSG